jgi:hypothetical protein
VLLYDRDEDDRVRDEEERHGISKETREQANHPQEGERMDIEDKMDGCEARRREKKMMIRRGWLH